jgi:deoxycytidylate deaminase
MKIMCAAGVKEIFYINDYNNDEIVMNISEMAKVTITKI